MLRDADRGRVTLKAMNKAEPLHPFWWGCLEHRLPGCCVSDLSIGFCKNATGVNSVYEVPQHPLLKTCSVWRNVILCICICHVISDQVSSEVAKFSVSLPLAEAWRSVCGPSRCGQTQELQRKCFFLYPFLIMILLHGFLRLAKLPEWNWMVMLWACSIFSVFDRPSCILWKWNADKAASLLLRSAKVSWVREPDNVR